MEPWLKKTFFYKQGVPTELNNMFICDSRLHESRLFIEYNLKTKWAPMEPPNVGIVSVLLLQIALPIISKNPRPRSITSPHFWK